MPSVTFRDYATLSLSRLTTNVPEGWTRFATDTQQGFNATAYVNTTDTLIIAYTGPAVSEPLPAWLNSARDAYLALRPFIDGLLRTQPNRSIAFTGFELGGVIAEVAASEFAVPAVSFNSPGALSIIQGLGLPADPVHAIRFIYATPNAVEQLGNPYATTYALYPAYTNVTDIARMQSTFNSFDPTTGNPYAFRQQQTNSTVAIIQQPPYAIIDDDATAKHVYMQGHVNMTTLSTNTYHITVGSIVSLHAQTSTPQDLSHHLLISGVPTLGEFAISGITTANADGSYTVNTLPFATTLQGNPATSLRMTVATQPPTIIDTNFLPAATVLIDAPQPIVTVPARNTPYHLALANSVSDTANTARTHVLLTGSEGHVIYSQQQASLNFTATDAPASSLECAIAENNLLNRVALVCVVQITQVIQLVSWQATAVINTKIIAQPGTTYKLDSLHAAAVNTDRIAVAWQQYDPDTDVPVTHIAVCAATNNSVIAYYQRTSLARDESQLRFASMLNRIVWGHTVLVGGFFSAIEAALLDANTQAVSDLSITDTAFFKQLLGIGHSANHIAIAAKINAAPRLFFFDAHGLLAHSNLDLPTDLNNLYPVQIKPLADKGYVILYVNNDNCPVLHINDATHKSVFSTTLATTPLSSKSLDLGLTQLAGGNLNLAYATQNATTTTETIYYLTVWSDNNPYLSAIPHPADITPPPPVIVVLPSTTTTPSAHSSPSASLTALPVLASSVSRTQTPSVTPIAASTNPSAEPTPSASTSVLTDDIPDTTETNARNKSKKSNLWVIGVAVGAGGGATLFVLGGKHLIKKLLKPSRHTRLPDTGPHNDPRDIPQALRRTTVAPRSELCNTTYVQLEMTQGPLTRTGQATVLRMRPAAMQHTTLVVPDEETPLVVNPLLPSWPALFALLRQADDDAATIHRLQQLIRLLEQTPDITLTPEQRALLNARLSRVQAQLTPAQQMLLTNYLTHNIPVAQRSTVNTALQSSVQNAPANRTRYTAEEATALFEYLQRQVPGISQTVFPDSDDEATSLSEDVSDLEAGPSDATEYHPSLSPQQILNILTHGMADIPQDLHDTLLLLQQHARTEGLSLTRYLKKLRQQQPPVQSAETPLVTTLQTSLHPTEQLQRIPAAALPNYQGYTTDEAAALFEYFRQNAMTPQGEEIFANWPDSDDEITSIEGDEPDNAHHSPALTLQEIFNMLTVGMTNVPEDLLETLRTLQQHARAAGLSLPRYLKSLKLQQQRPDTPTETTPRDNTLVTLTRSSHTPAQHIPTLRLQPPPVTTVPRYTGYTSEEATALFEYLERQNLLPELDEALAELPDREDEVGTERELEDTHEPYQPTLTVQQIFNILTAGIEGIPPELHFNLLSLQQQANEQGISFARYLRDLREQQEQPFLTDEQEDELAEAEYVRWLLRQLRLNPNDQEALANLNALLDHTDLQLNSGDVVSDTEEEESVSTLETLLDSARTLDELDDVLLATIDARRRRRSQIQPNLEPISTNTANSATNQAPALAPPPLPRRVGSRIVQANTATSTSDDVTTEHRTAAPAAPRRRASGIIQTTTDATTVNALTEFSLGTRTRLGNRVRVPIPNNPPSETNLPAPSPSPRVTLLSMPTPTTSTTKELSATAQPAQATPRAAALPTPTPTPSTVEDTTTQQLRDPAYYPGDLSGNLALLACSWQILKTAYSTLTRPWQIPQPLRDERWLMALANGLSHIARRTTKEDSLALHKIMNALHKVLNVLTRENADQEITISAIQQRLYRYLKQPHHNSASHSSAQLQQLGRDLTDSDYALAQVWAVQLYPALHQLAMHLSQHAYPSVLDQHGDTLVMLFRDLELIQEHDSKDLILLEKISYCELLGSIETRLHQLTLALNKSIKEAAIREWRYPSDDPDLCDFNYNAYLSDTLPPSQQETVDTLEQGWRLLRDRWYGTTHKTTTNASPQLCRHLNKLVQQPHTQQHTFILHELHDIVCCLLNKKQLMQLRRTAATGFHAKIHYFIPHLKKFAANVQTENTKAYPHLDKDAIHFLSYRLRKLNHRVGQLVHAPEIPRHAVRDLHASLSFWHSAPTYHHPIQATACADDNTQTRNCSRR